MAASSRSRTSMPPLRRSTARLPPVPTSRSKRSAAVHIAFSSTPRRTASATCWPNRTRPALPRDERHATVAMRLDERRRPVERLVEVLRADERVAAAALTSSYARGETDGLSDLDLLVGVLDAHAGESVPARRREVDRIAAVVWCFITVAGHPVDAVGQEDRRARPGPLKGAEQALPVGDREDRSLRRRQRRGPAPADRRRRDPLPAGGPG